MKKFFKFLKSNTLGAVLANIGLAIGVLITISVLYFYIYLPNATNHGDSITVPDLTGMTFEELESFLQKYDLRYEVEDSVYHEEYPPLTVLRQFPKAGSAVKQNRIIYVSVNPVMPPMVPMPDLANPNNTTSRIGAEAILKSNGLKRGRIINRPHIDLNLVLEMRYQGKKIEAGTKIPKGSVIDLVVGDGNGPNSSVLGNLVGDSYNMALFKLEGWNLRVGQVFVDADTTGADIRVWKQYPPAGDSVRVGDQIDLYIAPKATADELRMKDEVELDSISSL
jgi:beta-lactam-binding protein with PASTA domain